MTFNRYGNHLSRLLSSVFFIIAFSFFSCNRDKDKLELVPAKVDFISSVNVEKILTGLGASFDDKSSLETLASEKLLSDYSLLFTELHNSCDLSNMTAFSYKNKEYFLLDILDENKLKESLSTALSCTLHSYNEGDLYECPTGLVNVVIRNNICWIVDKSVSSSDIERVTDAADIDNISNNKFITEYISYPASVNLAIGNIPGVADRITYNGWITCRVELKKEDISLEISRVDSVGTKITTKGLLSLSSPDFLNFLPYSEIASGMMVVGIDGMNIDWQNNFAPLINFLGVRAQGLMDYLLPFLVQIDGPVAIGVAVDEDLDASNLSPSSGRIVGMVHMNPNGIRKALQTINNNLSWFGSKLTKSPDGGLILDMDDYKVYAGSNDQYLTVSNFPIEKSTGLENLSGAFAGDCKAGLYLDVKSLKYLGTGFPEWGMKVTGQYRDDVLRMTIKISGTDKPILQAILEM